MILPGDDLVPDASMTFDRFRTIVGPPDSIWPWLVQLGKGRAGWYLPGVVERRLIPRSRRAARIVDPRWQALRVGDRIPDYGGRDETLEVVTINAPIALVYRSRRGKARFSWALLLHPGDGGHTVVQLRFRGKLASTGWRRRVIVTLGEFFDWATSELMLRGLQERVGVGPVGEGVETKVSAHNRSVAP